MGGPKSNMATTALPLALLLSILCIFSALEAGAAAAASATATNFIKSSCSATRYPAVCVQSLSSYATAIQQNPGQLAQTALTVSVTKAQSASTFVSRMAKAQGMKRREYAAIKDCLDQLGDSVDRLSRSVRELQQNARAKGQDFKWHMSNVQTWVSAALTDENTCVDGFTGRSMDGQVKAAVRGRVVNVAEVTSNALALVNQYASRH